MADVDRVAIKTNSGPASNITVRNNKFYGTHGMSIGSQTMDGVTNVLWDDNRMFGTDQFGNVSTDNNGINIKSDYDCGGLIQQVTCRHTTLTGVKHLLVFNTSYGSCSGTPGVPIARTSWWMASVQSTPNPAPTLNLRATARAIRWVFTSPMSIWTRPRRRTASMRSSGSTIRISRPPDPE